MFCIKTKMKALQVNTQGIFLGGPWDDFPVLMQRVLKLPIQALCSHRKGQDRPGGPVAKVGLTPGEEMRTSCGWKVKELLPKMSPFCGGGGVRVEGSLG
jgi:hypothetical protein